MKRIALIIEDNMRTQIVARDRLSYLGLDVACVGSGEEALVWAATRVPNLVLLDIQLPGIDGRQTLQALRTLPDWQKVPVIAITASVMPSQCAALQGEGFDQVLEKPWTLIQRLDDAVHAALARG
jgi:CheY-like chemotaxis protein